MQGYYCTNLANWNWVGKQSSVTAGLISFFFCDMVFHLNLGVQTTTNNSCFWKVKGYSGLISHWLMICGLQTNAYLHNFDCPPDPDAQLCRRPYSTLCAKVKETLTHLPLCIQVCPSLYVYLTYSCVCVCTLCYSKSSRALFFFFLSSPLRQTGQADQGHCLRGMLEKCLSAVGE